MTELKNKLDELIDITKKNAEKQNEAIEMFSTSTITKTIRQQVVVEILEELYKLLLNNKKSSDEVIHIIFDITKLLESQLA